MPSVFSLCSSSFDPSHLSSLPSLLLRVLWRLLEGASWFHLWVECCSSNPQNCWCQQSSWWPSRRHLSHLHFFCTKPTCLLTGMDNWIDWTWREGVWLPVLGSSELRGNICGRWMGLTENPKLISQKLGDSVWYKLHFFQQQAFWILLRDVAWIKSISNFLEGDVELLLGFSLVQQTSRVGRREGGKEKRKRAGKSTVSERGYSPTYCPWKHQQIQSWDI